MVKVAENDRKPPSMLSPSPLALYVHWPFCLAKCPYCDFNSHVRESVNNDAFTVAYAAQLKYFSAMMGARQCHSIFFGGGTPSLMPPALVENILKTIDRYFPLTAQCEITLEANPTSVEAEKFTAFRAAGVNRVSLGIQSLRQEALQFLGREHDVAQAKQAIALAKKIFPRYSFDLIYARPEQGIEAWKEELDEALLLAEGHLSLYQLTIEKGTPFYIAHHQRKFTMPDETLAAELFCFTNETMQSIGMPPYEVSNYARVGQQCQHNLVYWRYHDYLGIGPGAHSRITVKGEKRALMQWHLPEKWLQEVQGESNGIQQSTTLTPREITEETMLMGLRLYEGIDMQAFFEQTGVQLEHLLALPKPQALLDAGLLQQEQGKLKATAEGMLVLNEVVGQLLICC
jgi:putative oxygen-independent coproporphyrinogen III oxidase